jgi:RimJ/RimL family protein N-acetyltransferase
MSVVFLESERLWFRAPEAADAEFFTAALHDPEVRRTLNIGRYPFNLAGEKAWLERHSEPPAFDNLTDVVLAFGLKDESQALGSTGLHRISMLHRRAEWGLFIGRPEHWGKGLGREIAAVMLEYAFNTLNLHRVYLRVDADNERGIRSYRAAGFTEEGRLRSHEYRDGAYHDMLMMGILKDEWQSA